MVTLLVLSVCLLVIGILFGKRFGVPVLGFAAGTVINSYMAVTAVTLSAPYLKQYVSYVPAALVLLPALLLVLFVKGRHRKVIPRIINSVVFAFAGLVFVVCAPSTPISLSGNFPIITQNAGIITTALLLLAIGEIAFGRASKKKVEDIKKK